MSAFRATAAISWLVPEGQAIPRSGNYSPGILSYHGTAFYTIESDERDKGPTEF
jgi:hypothetical protein